MLPLLTRKTQTPPLKSSTASSPSPKKAKTTTEPLPKLWISGHLSASWGLPKAWYTSRKSKTSVSPRFATSTKKATRFGLNVWERTTAAKSACPPNASIRKLVKTLNPQSAYKKPGKFPGFFLRFYTISLPIKPF